MLAVLASRRHAVLLSLGLLQQSPSATSRATSRWVVCRVAPPPPATTTALLRVLVCRWTSSEGLTLTHCLNLSLLFVATTQCLLRTFSPFHSLPPSLLATFVPSSLRQPLATLVSSSWAVALQSQATLEPLSRATLLVVFFLVLSHSSLQSTVATHVAVLNRSC